MTPKSESERAEPVESVECEESAILNEEKKEETVEEAEVKTESFTESALKCFGWKEIKTEKWLVKCAKAWYGAMSFAWFLFGAITFAPIIFMQNKVNAIFKDKKKSLFVSIGIYGAIWALIIVNSII